MVPAGEDDPDKMAALEWSEGFRPPSAEKARTFWQEEHRRVAEEYAAAAEKEEKDRKDIQDEAGGGGAQNIVSLIILVSLFICLLGGWPRLCSRAHFLLIFVMQHKRCEAARGFTKGCSTG